MYCKRVLFACLLVSALALPFMTACGQGATVGDLQTKTETIERGDAESVNVKIRMGAGELQISGGASDLLDATYTYNVEELNPGATYEGGNLTVQDAEVKTTIRSLFNLDDYRNEWDLRFSEDVPMEMQIDAGAGRCDLSLGKLALTRLDMSSGAGDVKLDLGGSQSLSSFDYEMGAGDSTLDLSGDWQTDLDGTIRGGVGKLTVKLPSNVGVRIDVDAGVGSINTSGMTRNGNIYTNDAYGESDINMIISIDAGVGEINLEVG
jgi:hypothetical protein